MPRGIGYGRRRRRFGRRGGRRRFMGRRRFGGRRRRSGRLRVGIRM